MRTFWIFTTFVAIFILAVWMFAERVVQRTPELKQQPHITEVHGNHGEISLSDLKGKYVLVNFWDSHNAVSRIAAGEYDRFFRDNKHKNIQLLSVNTDDNLKLFNEIVRNDGLDSLTQFHIRNVKAHGISPGYHPEGGYSSYLINPAGKIIAVNPSIKTIKKIINL